jgi:hypothetical protein
MDIGNKDVVNIAALFLARSRAPAAQPDPDPTVT